MKPEELTEEKALRQYWKIMNRTIKRPEKPDETVILDSLEATIRAFRTAAVV